MWRDNLWARIAAVEGGDIWPLALEVFDYQYENNALYRRFADLLGRRPGQVRTWADLPFLPIAFFKSHELRSGDWAAEQHYLSSGTSGQSTSRHAVRDVAAYLQHAQRLFEAVYGPLSQYCVLALLPAYLERPGSSLVAMAGHFIVASGHPDSGFYLHDTAALVAQLARQRAAGQPTLLLGVSFALWDLAERHPMDLSGQTIIMETGGMKGRRPEIVREALHRILCDAFRVPAIHSEYGMTELLSQAYSTGEGRFRPSATLRALPRELNDPLSPERWGRTAALNIVDLANLDTCAFIATEDLGRVQADGHFEVLGRFDHSEQRGCNLMFH